MMVGGPLVARVGAEFRYVPELQGPAPHRISVSGLGGTGLVLAPFTGIVTGTPEGEAATRELVFEVTDATGSTAVLCCSLSIEDDPKRPRLSRSCDGSVGQIYALSQGSAQWTRTSLGAGARTTDIPGAVGPSYVATAWDVGLILGARTADWAVRAFGPVLEAPILIEDFSEAAGFIAGAGEGGVAPSEPLAEGRAGLTLFQTEAGGGAAQAERAAPGFDPSRLDVVVVAIRSASENVTSWECRYVRGADAVGPSVSVGKAPPPRGLRFVSAVAPQSPGPTPEDAQGSVRLRSRARNAALPATVGFAALVGRARGRPTVVFTFDDGHRAPIVLALPSFDRYGAKATFYPPSKTLRAAAGGTGRMARSDLAALVAAGHHVGCDTSTDAPYPSFGGGTRAGAVAEWRSEVAKLGALGVPEDHLRHICYPNGLFRRETRRSFVPSAHFDGTRSFRILEPPTVPLHVGMTIGGWNVPVGTRIATLAADQSGGELSARVPAQVIAFEAVDEDDEFFGRRLIDDLQAAGVRTARATVAIDPPRMHTRFGFGDMACMLTAQSMTGKGFPEMKSLIDDAVEQGTTNIVYLHDLLPPGQKQGINVFVSDLVAAIAYAGELMAAGTLDILSIKQLWERDGSSGLPV